MLTGSADPDLLARGAPRMETLHNEALSLPGVELLQVLCEIDAKALQSLLPPALHPTLPPLASWAVLRARESPWGPFSLAQLRIECRSGTRPRVFPLSGVVDNPRAGRGLASGWGYRLGAGEVELRRSYHETVATVQREGARVLELGYRDPVPLGAADVQYMASMNLAHAPAGLRLVQVDCDHAVREAERGVPVLTHFDAGAWGAPDVCPTWPVSACLSVCDLTLPRLRFACRPDVPAFAGTERIG